MFHGADGACANTRTVCFCAFRSRECDQDFVDSLGVHEVLIRGMHVEDAGWKPSHDGASSYLFRRRVVSFLVLAQGVHNELGSSIRQLEGVEGPSTREMGPADQR